VKELARDGEVGQRRSSAEPTEAAFADMGRRASARGRRDATVLPILGRTPHNLLRYACIEVRLVGHQDHALTLVIARSDIENIEETAPLSADILMRMKDIAAVIPFFGEVKCGAFSGEWRA